MHLIKTAKEIKKIAVAGKILAATAKKLLSEVRVGLTLKDLDEMAFKLITEAGAKPAFLNYRPEGAKKPYPCSICASVNEVVVHGQPTSYSIKDGDVLKLDMGVLYDGWNADAAWTIGVGRISPEAKKLMEVAKKALQLAINECKPGKTLGDIGYAISRYVRRNGFFTLRGLTGHGIGRELHEEPTVLNEGRRGEGMELRPGMVLAIEPMIAIGTDRIKQLADESYATIDGSNTAHFEHTIVITEHGVEVLTI